jgi:hypothetical protein
MPTLYLTSILNAYEVFEHLHVLWVVICVHPYAITPVKVEAKFWKIGGKVEPKS